MISEAGKKYIAEQFGAKVGTKQCWVYSGLSWRQYAIDGTFVDETGGTGKVVSRVIGAVTDRIELKTPRIGTYKKSDLTTANAGEVTLIDIRDTILKNDGYPSGETQYCVAALAEKLSAPKNIRATTLNSSFAYVEWNAVMECNGACEYNIWLDGVKRTETAFSPTPGIDLEELDGGRTYKLEIQTKSPPGATYIATSNKVPYSFTTLTAAPPTCNQSFRIIEKDTNNPISGATVTADGKKCTTDALGKCTIELTKGKTISWFAGKSGYSAVGYTFRFTACAAEKKMVLVPVTLSKECRDYTTQAECEAVGCYWYMGRCAGTPEQPPEVAKFGLSEVVENHLPEWISGYKCCSCGGLYICKCPVGYKLTKCETQARLGGHGCSTYDIVAFIKCEQEGVTPPKKGFLTVNTSPTGATVIVNGVSCGTTPVTKCELDTGTKTVTIAKSGYETVTRSVTITAGATPNLGTITLTPTVALEEPYVEVEIVEEEVLTEKAYVHILQAVDAAGAELSRASIYVDGVDLHHWAPEELTFCAGCKCDTYVDCGLGVHNISVRKDGYDKWYVIENFEGGKTYTYTPRLSPPEEGEATVTGIGIPSKMAIKKTYTGAVILTVHTKGMYGAHLDFHRKPGGWDGTIARLPAATTSIHTESATLNVGKGRRLNWTWKVPKITKGKYIVVSRLFGV